MPIGGLFKNRQDTDGEKIDGYGFPLARGKDGQGYSVRHVLLAGAALLSALICLGLREKQLRDYLVTASSKGCDDDTLRAYLGKSTAQGEQMVMIGALVSGTFLLASMAVRTAFWYPGQGEVVAYSLTAYGAFSKMERIFEVALAAMLGIAMNAAIMDRPVEDGDVAMGAGAAYTAAKAAGKCHKDAPDSLEKALGTGVYTGWAVALASLYLLVRRIIGIQAGRTWPFDLDKLF